MTNSMFDQACQLFDEYNSRDPKSTIINDNEFSDSLLYAQRMTAKLSDFAPNASEELQLAARCQHIGRWEIPRQDYPMDRKGYLQWRSQLKLYHAKIAASILEKCGYKESMISKVKDLLVKKQLKQNPDTQTLEDVICLVFLEFYFDDFSKEHEEEKLINILKKTIAKMSSKGVEAAMKLPLSNRATALIGKAS
jgi:hypothetical protein